MTIKLEELEAELDDVRKKLHTWIQARHTVAVDCSNNFAFEMQQQSDVIQKLQKQQTQFTEASEAMKNRLSSEKQQLDGLKDSLRLVVEKKLEFEQDLNLLTKAVEIEKQEYLKQVSEFDAEDKERSRKLDLLRKSVARTSERLGMTFKQEDGELRIKFTCIDPYDPDKEFSFNVKVLENNSYKVTKCYPQLVTLQDLVHRLNSTNDFSEFVKSLRRHFAQLVKDSGSSVPMAIE